MVYKEVKQMYYTVDEVSEKLKLNPETVRNFIRRGELQAYKFGKTYRIDEEELERFLQTKIKKNA